MSDLVKVRVLIAVDHTGNWTCQGWAGASGRELKDSIFIDVLEEGEQYHWITAELPVPKELEVDAVTAMAEDLEEGA